MNNELAKKQGATHYLPMLDGITPQLYYRLNPIGTLSYISFSGLWVGSNINGDEEKFNRLVSKLIKL